MSPFSGEGVNLALADAVALAAALTGGEGWQAVSRYEVKMVAGAKPSAVEAAEALRSAFAANGVDRMLAHYRERAGG